MALNDKEKEGKSTPCFEKAIRLIINAREIIINVHMCTIFGISSFEENERTRDPRLYMNVKPIKMSRSRGITPIPFVGSKERTIKSEEITNPDKDNTCRGRSPCLPFIESDEIRET